MDISQTDTSKLVEGLHAQVVLLENFILVPRYHPIEESGLSCWREITCGMAREDETQQGEGGHLEENQGPLAKFLVNSMRPSADITWNRTTQISPQKWDQ